MNIYFSPAKHNELKFPPNDLSIINTFNNIANDDKETNLNYENSDLLNKKEIQTSHLYKKYGLRKNLFERTQSQKKLNKIKVYFIVKSKIVKGKEIKYALPIRSFDDLNNSILEKSNTFKTSIFDLKTSNNTHRLKNNIIDEGSPELSRYLVSFFLYLEDLVHPEPPFNVKQEFLLEKLVLPTNEGNYIFKQELSKDKELKSTKPGKLAKNQIPSLKELVIGFGPNYSLIDNTFIINSSRYGTDLINKNNFNKKKKDTNFLSYLKDINEKESFRKFLKIWNIFSISFHNTNSSLDKNIIPVFSNLEDAQEFLITILEEINQPFQVRRKIENSSTAQDYKSLNYLDDSFSFQNSYVSPCSSSKIKRIKELLKRYRIIKSTNLLKDYNKDFYNKNNYQTKRPFFFTDIKSGNIGKQISQPSKTRSTSTWKEIDYLSILDNYFPGQYEEFSWGESRNLTITDKRLLKKSQDIKIISMGVGDFFEFWNNSKKNGEVLFIPSSNEFNRKQFNLSPKKPSDRFYQYQEKFQKDKMKNTQNYIYNIKISSE